MSVQNPDRIVTKQDLKDFYDSILPYLGGVSSAGFTPVGTIIAVMGVNAPANYLKCDGTVYNIASYIELSNYFKQQFGSKNYFGGDGTTTFAVPDLRGEFLRGTGTNSHANQGSGAAVGTHQDATYQPNVMCGDKTISGVKTDLDTANNNSIREQDKNVTRIPSGIISGQTQTITKYTVSNVSTGVTSSTETGFYARPTNTSVLYCIATKNIYLNPSLDYSTEERIIGTWIDGKPLYQKTFEGTLTQAVQNIAHNIANIDSILPVTGTLLVDASNKAYIPFGFYNGNYYAACFATKTNFCFRVHEEYVNKSYTVIIQYTKTTD